ncbi:MAG: glycosyltransferase family 4 protein [Nitrospira sp.]
MAQAKPGARLKIAVLIKRLVKTGGAERYAMEIVRRLALNHDVHVFAHEWSYDGSEPITFHKIRRLCVKPAWANQLLFSYLTQRAVGQDFDIVHSFEKVTHCDVMTVQSPCFGKPSGGEQNFLKSAFKWIGLILSPRSLAWRWLESRQFSERGAQVVIAVSEQVKRNVQAHYHLPDQRFALAYTGVESPGAAAGARGQADPGIRAQLGAGQRDLVVLFVGTEFKRKGLDALLHGLALLPRSRVTLLVAGGGGGRLDHYKAVTESLGLGREVKFLGLISDVERLYPVVDLFILPTLADPCPLSPLEAMAAGVATIMSSSEFNGSAELVRNGEALILSHPDDPHEIAAALTKMMDAQSRAALAEQGRQLVHQFTWEKTTADTVAAYHAVIRTRRMCRQASG